MSEQSKTTVGHVYRDVCDVCIDRSTKWGNTFIIGKDGTRAEVIEKYREWIKNQPHLMSALPELRGKKLSCWCSPLPCHGDVLAEMANAL